MTTLRTTIVDLDGQEQVETFEADMTGYPPAEHGGAYDLVYDWGTPTLMKWREIVMVEVVDA